MIVLRHYYFSTTDKEELTEEEKKERRKRRWLNAAKIGGGVLAGAGGLALLERGGVTNILPKGTIAVDYNDYCDLIDEKNYLRNRLENIPQATKNFWDWWDEQKNKIK